MKPITLSFAILILLVISHAACKHDVLLSDMDPISNPGDTTITTPGDPADPGVNVRVCDPDTLYFEKDILPILVGNCAYSGCHDVTTAEEGVILNNFTNVINTGEVVPFDLADSELYEKITETDPDDIMPPPPNPALSPQQINIIARWIQQGAQNLECDQDAGVCDTLNVSYQGYIAPLLQTYCLGCHNSASASGGIVLEGYDNVNTYVGNGRLYGAVAWQDGYVTMPQGQGQLPACDISKLKSWIDEGAPNN